MPVCWSVYVCEGGPPAGFVGVWCLACHYVGSPYRLLNFDCVAYFSEEHVVEKRRSVCLYIMCQILFQNW